MIILPPLAAAAAMLIAAPAPVQRGIVETQTTVVTRVGLDLTRDRDLRTLDLRVARAARRVCGEASSWDVEGVKAVRRCQKTTIAAFAQHRARLVASAQRNATALSSR